MEKQLIQSRLTKNNKRSKNLYFLPLFFLYLFRRKHNLRNNSQFDYWKDRFQFYTIRKTSITNYLVIVGFFLLLSNNKHIINTPNTLING